ncbi:MAG: hypothetical protein P4L87_24100 [Formivibrio sp.]|nr:hypothetical protein [Formivibrio sp.]
MPIIISDTSSNKTLSIKTGQVLGNTTSPQSHAQNKSKIRYCNPKSCITALHTSLAMQKGRHAAALAQPLNITAIQAETLVTSWLCAFKPDAIASLI